MPGKIRARHEVFGVKDVPDTDHYRNNGWKPVDPDTPLTVDVRRQKVNKARSVTPRAASKAVAAAKADDKNDSQG